MPQLTSSSRSLQQSSVRVARAHFYYVAVFAALIVVSDAWNLITPSVVLQRWTVAAVMLSVVSLVWYLARDKARGRNFYRNLVGSLIALDILVATYLVYSQRGLASRAVALFVIPIIVSTILGRVALFTTAALCTAAYTTAGVRYFVVHPGESYKIELYAELGFYCAIFFLMSMLLWTVRRRNR